MYSPERSTMTTRYEPIKGIERAPPEREEPAPDAGGEDGGLQVFMPSIPT